ncbi:hypothetical protein [Pararhizobium sp.]|uniref:hypothetical protein n=1 Tax=Pararhizobium sp. TaxID=1977563 RepID=UPI003D120067
MSIREPTPAVQRLWQARIKSELVKGTPVEETNLILNQMMANWQAIEDNEMDATDPPNVNRKTV